MTTHEIKVQKLELHNYYAWKSIVQKAAIVQEVDEYLTSNLVPPNEPTQLASHRKKQAQASLLIENSVSLEVATLLGPTEWCSQIQHLAHKFTARFLFF